MKQTFPAAMPAPETSVTYITTSIVENAIELSKISPRKRIIFPFHKESSDSLHRMFNVVQPGTYIRPHHHKNEDKSEAIVVLKGAICFITFEEDGTIKSYENIKAGSDVFGVDLEPDTIHTFVVLESDTVIFEVKPGPYIKSSDKDFMSWSPEEGTADCNAYVNELLVLTNNK